tara:strand:- start:110 stop:349 length:240 start_codon:yes stop_codon:yes gene_type:complete
MKIGAIILGLILFGIYLFYFFTGYKSAFEADQQCHYLLKSEYSENSNFGCDHDLETRQWLLFKISEENKPSVVLKRFRY